MDKYEYKVETVKGLFTFRSTKLIMLNDICNRLGNQGWELVNVAYDGLIVSYTLFFKRKKPS